jgi:hypothetical protein
MPVAEYASGALEPARLQHLVDYVDGLKGKRRRSSTATRYLSQVYASWLARFAAEKAYVKKKPLSLFHIYTRHLHVKDRMLPFGATQDDITSLGPLYYKHPGIKPFFLTPQTAFKQGAARVGFDGSNYLVVWCENHYTQGDWLMGCRVSPQGNVLDPGGFPIHKWGEHIRPRLAMGKDVKTGQPVSLVVWTEFSPYPNVRGALVRTAGQPQVIGHVRTASLNGVLTGIQAVNSEGIPIFPDIDDHFSPWMEYKFDQGYMYPDLTFNGTDFVVTAITEDCQVVARLVSSEGYGVKVEQPPQTNVIYPWGKPITIKLWNGALVAGYCPTTTRIKSRGGPQCLVTWSILAAPGISHLYGAKLIFSGPNWQIGQAKVISQDVEPPYGHCTMASDGQGSYLLAWHDIRQAAQKKTQPWQTAWPDLARAVVTPVAGQPLDFNVQGSTLMFEANHCDYYPGNDYDGKNYLVTWRGITSDLTHFNPKLACLVSIKLGAYVTPDGQLLESFYIKAEDGGGVEGGDVCFGSTEGLVVYEHDDVSKWNPPASDRKLRLRFVAKTP